MNTPLASIPFIDGIVRPVFLDVDGRQYVLDNDGNAVYGSWIYVDEPLIVRAATDRGSTESWASCDDRTQRTGSSAACGPRRYRAWFQEAALV
jgi:hypothetical protein